MIDNPLYPRFCELAEMRDGWHNGDGLAPNQFKTAFVFGCWLAYCTESLPVPSLFPTFEGNLLFEWASVGCPSLDLDMTTLKGQYHSILPNNGDYERDFDLTTKPGWVELFSFLSYTLQPSLHEGVNRTLTLSDLQPSCYQFVYAWANTETLADVRLELRHNGEGRPSRWRIFDANNLAELSSASNWASERQRFRNRDHYRWNTPEEALAVWLRMEHEAPCYLEKWESHIHHLKESGKHALAAEYEAAFEVVKAAGKRATP